MNSALQCLSHTEGLTEYFLQNSFKTDVNKDNSDGSGGDVSDSYGDLINKLWDGSDNSVKPTDFKYYLSKHNPFFEGYEQHDSFEWILSILHFLNEDLNKVTKKPYCSSLSTKGKELIKLSSEQWDYFLSRNDSPITQFFHLQLHTSQTCEEWDNKTHYFEENNALSCQLLSDKDKVPAKSSLTFIVHPIDFIDEKRVRKIMVECDSKMKLNEIIEKVDLKQAEMWKTNGQQLGEDDLTLKSKSFDKTTIECFEIRNTSENDECLKINIFMKTYETKGDETFCILKKSPNRINVAVNLDDKVEKVYYKVFCHLFGISKFATKTQNYRYNFNENIQTEYSAFCEAFKDSNKKQPFQLEITNPSNELLFKLDQNFDPSCCFLFFNQDIKMKDIFNLLDGKTPEFRLIYLNEEVISYSKLNKVFEKSFYLTNHVLPRNKEKNKSIYDWIDDFCNVSEFQEIEMNWKAWGALTYMKRKVKISKTSDYLVIHLERFKSSFSFGMHMEKNNEVVDFPTEGLDISKYIDSFASSDASLSYDLYGVIHHSGGLHWGHYWATCKNFRDNKWYSLNDSSVKSANKRDIVAKSAYVLFYKRSQSKSKKMKELNYGY
jgi:ubiquitin C-terminal hydrolase